ncbi:hypothetical protein HYS47_05325 [Candidatus Woesearchaeota archaeon]|nr:hypothetical protein [Candidatus Woesearchaeota archaeon]
MAKKSGRKNVRMYPAEEQGIEKEETREEVEQDMQEGEKEADVYSSAGRKVLRDDDEVDDWEEGFMDGAEAGGGKAKCMKCGTIIEMSSCVEQDIDGELKWFCSDKCLKKYEKEH